MKLKKNDLFMGIYILSAVLFFIISIPSWLLDIMLAINIGIALIILFNTLYAKEVLDTCGIPREALLAEKEDLYEQLAQVNQQIRQERWKLKQCKEISETAAIMQKDVDRVEQQPQRMADTRQR